MGLILALCSYTFYDDNFCWLFLDSEKGREHLPSEVFTLRSEDVQPTVNNSKYDHVMECQKETAASICGCCFNNFFFMHNFLSHVTFDAFSFC